MVPRTSTRSESALARAQAGLVAASFAMLLAGSNACYPLLPIYRDRLGLSPLLLSLTFTLYVAVLVTVLFTLARPRFARHAAPLLVASLALMIASDLLLAHQHESLILLGRALAGAAGGLGTGAASALVVAAVGARGRAVTSTGNLVGAVIGAGGTQLVIGGWSAQAPRVVFWGHAVVMGLLLVAVSAVLWARRLVNRPALAPRPSTVGSAPSAASAPVVGSSVRLFATGAIAWTSLSVTIVFGATVFGELDRPAVQAVGPVALLFASAAAQLASPTLARRTPRMSGVLLAAAGLVGVGAGTLLDSDVTAVAGFLSVGVGSGIAYRAALLTLTRGASSAHQGASASLYAAITYTVAASVVLLVGAVGGITGLVPATVATLSLLAVLAATSLRWATRLPLTTDDPAVLSGSWSTAPLPLSAETNVPVGREREAPRPLQEFDS